MHTPSASMFLLQKPFRDVRIWPGKWGGCLYFCTRQRARALIVCASAARIRIECDSIRISTNSQTYWEPWGKYVWFFPDLILISFEVVVWSVLASENTNNRLDCEQGSGALRCDMRCGLADIYVTSCCSSESKHEPHSSMSETWILFEKCCEFTGFFEWQSSDGILI